MNEEKRKLIRGTFCILQDTLGRYLMRYEPKGINANCWKFPGGSFEFLSQLGRIERGVECAIRETAEETGIIPINPFLKAIITFDNHARIFPGKTEVADFDYEGHFYATREYSGEFKEIGPAPDSYRQGWFSYEALQSMPMHEGDRAILQRIHSSDFREQIEGVIVHEGSRLVLADF